jgi:3'-phosphoadenosine 5'-phosphosulfate sulfotransferase (PAPS reductase)/FAD synthetase
MPRAKEYQKNLSEGWKDLYKQWEEPLETKITKSLELIDYGLRQSKSPVLCWSGGKDSGVILDLTRKIKPDIPVIFIKTGVDFPETVSYVEQYANTAKLNLSIIGPEKGNDFWSIGKKYGWPIFGKNIASNVERARRTGNIRKQLSAFEKDLVKTDIKISCKCAEILQEKSSKILEKKMNADLKIIGLRAEESRTRVRLWVDYGNLYYVKKYYNHKEGIYKLNPISVWTEKDVWAYYKMNNIRKCSLYEMGYPRNGCWTCAMAVRNEQLHRLKKYHRNYFEELVYSSPMKNDIHKALAFISKEKIKNEYSKSEIENILNMNWLYN